MLVQTVDADPPNAVKSISLTVQCQTLINFNYDILIKVNDANDNTPFFIGAPYTVSVSEATAINEVIFAGIEADDNDGDNRNGQISFEIVPNQNDPMSNSYFDMPNTGKGEVTLLQSLDFETRQQWTVSIVAKGLIEML
ncbi:protocadherin-15-like [Strongylocentrotus purpuratus]|uniref:Cadherin domain-containing protein n=1 Tax=Strongylocentrotus purpuratus TaxID=7668 RepID=A0A7M7SVS3_STRPU|nr:protocadherin-15-like [Strongylocentrotus purpuratus]